MKIIATIVFLLYVVGGMAQGRPEWVKQRPVNTLFYTGIAQASKNEPDYASKAKDRALRDLVSEIKVTVRANSLLKTLEQNGEIRSDYEETIKTEATESIEKYELVDSWQNDGEYWVYYQLNRFDYEEYVTKRREQAIRTGFDYWYKGEVALQEGNLMTAIEFYLKGLEAVQPVANEQLTCEYDGQAMDVGRELYTSLNRVFSGVSIVATPNTLEGKAFRGIEQPVKLSVMRKGVPLKNLTLNCAFAVGDGQLSGTTLTGETGEAELYVRNITSKQSEQEIRVSLDQTPFSRLKNGVYKKLVDNILSASPQCVIYLRMGQTQLNAYLVPVTGTDAQVKQSVQRILTDRFFNMVSVPGEADLLIKLSSNFRKGETTVGDMRDFVTWHAGVNISMENKSTGQVISNYVLDDVKVLQPSTVSTASAKSAAIRELTRQMQRGLPKELAGLNINTEGTRKDQPVVEEKTLAEAPSEEKIKVDSEVTPVITVTERTVEGETVKPVEKDTKKTVASSTEPKVMEGELRPGFFIRYMGMKKMTDRTILTFSAINRTGDDRELNLVADRIKIINERGEEVGMLKMQIGSSGHTNWAKALVAVEVPTSIVFEIKPLEKAALVQIEDNDGYIVKFRNIQ